MELARSVGRTAVIRSSRVAVGLLALIATIAAAMVATAGVRVAPAGATTTSTLFTMTTFRGSAVDPATGRLFVAGDNVVKVFNADGTLRGTIANVFGAGAPFVSGGDLWVPETTAGKIARIDIPTATIAQTFTIGSPVHNTVAVHNGLVWFATASSGISSYAQLATLDPATGTVVPRGGSFYSAFIRTVPGATDRLLVGEPGLSPFSVYLVDTSGPTITVLDDVPHGVGSNLSDLAVSADGQRMVTASGAPYLFPEFALSTMDPDGLEYPGTHYPNGVAYAPANGGLFAGSVAWSNALYVWPDGQPVTGASFSTSGLILPSSVELAHDGSRVYAVVESVAGTMVLETFDATAAITSVVAGQSVAFVPTDVTVYGQNLGAVTGATIGGLDVSVWDVTTTQVNLEVPSILPAGTYTLTLTSALGSPSVPFTVVPNTGATLTGTVSSPNVGPIAGVELSLDLEQNEPSLVATSDANGNYTFTGVPFGDHTLWAFDLGHMLWYQTVHLVPNDTTVLDVGLELIPRDPPGDYDGNGTSDPAVFRPDTGMWFVPGRPAVQFGTDGDLPVPGQYENNGGPLRLAVFRPATGTWFVQDGPTVQWGAEGDVPVPGHYDGDSSTGMAVFRPSTGVWFIRNGPTVQFGTPGDVPVPGDYDGDGDTDIAVFRPSTGTWFVHDGPTLQFGTAGDIPVPADYDGDDIIDIAVFRPSTGTWFFLGGTAVNFGTEGDVPVPGDYDGDGSYDVAVFRPSTGMWFVHDGPAVQWGTAGDIPAH